MSRKNESFLGSMLTVGAGDESLDPTVTNFTDKPRKQIGTSVSGPNGVIQNLVSGNLKQVVQKLVDPARCRIWSGNARNYSKLNFETCQELIDSIISENGQKVPAIVRKVTDDPEFDYEVLVGTRRHWSITWLRNNNYPDIMFLVQPELMSDEAAFRWADLENRPRTDVSGYERAVNYAEGVAAYYDGQPQKMADRLHLQKGTLSKLLAVARLPSEIVEAYAAYADIQISVWYPKIKTLEDDREVHARAIGEARQIIAEQGELEERQQPKISGPAVTARLFSAMNKKMQKSNAPTKTDYLLGELKLVSVAYAGKKRLDLKIHKVAGATRADIIQRVNAALDASGID